MLPIRYAMDKCIIISILTIQNIAGFSNLKVIHIQLPPSFSVYALAAENGIFVCG
jgi:hypothetical protein